MSVLLKSPPGVRPLPYGVLVFLQERVTQQGCHKKDGTYAHHGSPGHPASGASALAICRDLCYFICLPPPGVHSDQAKELTLVARFSTCSQASLEKENYQCPQTCVRSVRHCLSPVSTSSSGKVAR